MKEPSVDVVAGDCLQVLRKMECNSVDFAMWSPPYHGKMRRYPGYSDGETGRKKNGFMSDKQWAAWQADIIEQCVRVCRGMVIVVANGCVRQGKYHPSCERLIVECDDRGIPVERPVIWHKNAPPSRKNWFGNDWEFCLAFGTKTTWEWERIGTPPKYTSGGDFRQRDQNGKRRKGGKYPKNKVTRPRDVIRVTVGGGHMGSHLSHENEAPYPEKLVEPFLLALSNEGDTVLDPCCGSGTTLAVAARNKRNAIGIDIRESQVDLTKRRIDELTSKL